MRYDDPNVPASAIVGIVSAIALFVVIVLLQGLFYSMQEGELERKVYSQTSEELRALDADQLKQLNSYGWVSEPDGVAHIPIDRAMDLVAQEGAGSLVQ
jgi:hypothetical protein